VKETAIKFFNLEYQLPSNEIIPTEAEDKYTTQSDRTITDLKLQEKIEKLVKNVKEEDMKCYYTRFTYCPCGRCKSKEDKTRCIIHNCSCLYHLAKSLKASAKSITNKYQAHTTATTFNALLMGTTKAPKKVIHSILRQYVDDPEASTIKPKRNTPNRSTTTTQESTELELHRQQQQQPRHLLTKKFRN
jgi:hypothetical protein